MPNYTLDHSGTEDLDEEIHGDVAGDTRDEPAARTGQANGESERYVPAGATFDFQNSSEYIQAVRDALLAHETTLIYCRYDGGGDEGFAHFDSAAQHHRLLAPAAMANILKGSPLVRMHIRMYGEHGDFAYIQKHFDMLTESEQIGEVLDHFALVLARHLLGDGFGTGEYKMRGNFSANLVSGRLVDLRDDF